MGGFFAFAKLDVGSGNLVIWTFGFRSAWVIARIVMINEYAFVGNIFLVIHFSIILRKQKIKRKKSPTFLHRNSSHSFSYFHSSLYSHACVILHSFNTTTFFSFSSSEVWTWTAEVKGVKLVLSRDLGVLSAVLFVCLFMSSLRRVELTQEPGCVLCTVRNTCSYIINQSNY